MTQDKIITYAILGGLAYWFWREYQKTHLLVATPQVNVNNPMYPATGVFPAYSASASALNPGQTITGS